MAIYEKSVPNPRGALYYVKLEVTENSVDEEANSSNVTAVLSFKGPYSSSLSGWTLHSGIQLVGAGGAVIQATADPSPSIGMSYREIMRMTADVPHNPDGKLDMICRCWIWNADFGSSAYTYAPNWFSDSNTPAVMGVMPLTDLYHEPVWGDVSDFTFEEVIQLPCTHSSLTDELRVTIDGYPFAVRNNWRGQSIVLDADELLAVYEYLAADPDPVDVRLTIVSRDGTTVKATVEKTVEGRIRGQLYRKGTGYGVMCIKTASGFKPMVLTNGGRR